MAKLTDLPTELLEVIFREFLSKQLADHEYMCKWNLESDAVRTRATLYSLSMVSKALSEIALPLLYEQLFGYEDVQKLLTGSGSSHGTAPQYLAYTRYLRIEYDLRPEEAEHPPMATLDKWLPYCTRVQHLSLAFGCSSYQASSLLLYLAGLPGLSGLQSLDIVERSCLDEGHTLLQDLCSFSSLIGLSIWIGDWLRPIGCPKKALESLQFLQVDHVDKEDALLACMALASPEKLQTLRIRDEDDTNSLRVSLSKVLGEHTWTELEEVEFPQFVTATPDSLASASAQLPALRRLHLRLNFLSTPGKVLPVIPAGVVVLEIIGLDMTQLENALNLIARADWLDGQIQQIALDLSRLGDWLDSSSDDFYNDPYINGQAYSKKEFMDIARDAILAANTVNVKLEPEDIVAQIARLDFLGP